MALGKHLLDVFQGDLLRLLGGNGCDVHLQGCQPQGYVVFQLGPKSLLDDIVATLQRDQQRVQVVKECAAPRCLEEQATCVPPHFRGGEAESRLISAALPGIQPVFNRTHKHGDHTKHLTSIDKRAAI